LVLSSDQILELFEIMNHELSRRNEIGEIGLVGGAVMCLVFKAREATRDVDAIFQPAELVRKLAAQIGEQKNLPPDWLNDAAKGFIQKNFQRNDVLNLSNLRVWAPDAKYMLAMKCISARWDTSDREDVIFLIQFLKLTDSQSVFKIIEHFYPKKQIPAKTQFFIEEVIENLAPETEQNPRR
jgi:hypothetical protein